jgi:hypothetical protein
MLERQISRQKVLKQFNNNKQLGRISSLASAIPRTLPPETISQLESNGIPISGSITKDLEKKFKSLTQDLCTLLCDGMTKERVSNKRFPYLLYVDPADWEAKTGLGVGHSITFTRTDKTRTNKRRVAGRLHMLDLSETENNPSQSGVKVYLTQEDGIRRLLTPQGDTVSQIERTDTVSGSRGPTTVHESQDTRAGGRNTNQDYTSYRDGGSALEDHAARNAADQKAPFTHTDEDWNALTMDMGFDEDI